MWLAGLAGGVGAGADALRVAVAESMRSAAATVGRPAVEEEAGRAFLDAVSRAIPGACVTYRLTAEGAAAPPEYIADHSPCVQRDLSRREGPGGTYGVGLWRAAAGALAFWTEAERALRRGLGAMQDATAKARVEGALGTIEAATRAAKLRTSEPRVNADWERLMQESHGSAFGAKLPRELGVLPDGGK
jgi:hypothetical protein